MKFSNEIMDVFVKKLIYVTDNQQTDKATTDTVESTQFHSDPFGGIHKGCLRSGGVVARGGKTWTREGGF